MYLDDRRPTITPQLARRVAILGGIAIALAAIVLFRLWFLQVLSGDRYLAEARDNQVREIKIQAPRGEIVDRKGRVLVDNRSAYAVKINPVNLPSAASPRTRRERTRLYIRLGRVLGMTKQEIRTRVRDQLRAVPFSKATVKQDVSQPVVAYLEERKRRFPGVEVEPVFLRTYPRGQVGAHLFGWVTEINEKQLKDPIYRGVTQGDRIGQSGIEYSYDRFLRGENGQTRVQVDASGALVPGRRPKVKDAKAGRQLRLTLDLDVQRAGQRALEGRKGAFVAMEAKTGAIRAIGSAPSFDPSRFARVIKQSDYDALTSKKLGEPLVNRATQSTYPTGSVFKLITATAALEGGFITPDEPVYDPGCIKVGDRDRCNAKKVANGTLAMRRALEVSSDVYFYKLGMEMDGAGNGRNLQRWADRLGLGRATGVDLPAEGKGLVPDDRWRARFNRENSWADQRPWSLGDAVNLSVGQGDLQANPLQVAIAYAAIANGGRIVRPHLGARVEDADGAAIQELKVSARRRIKVKPANRQAIMDGLRQAASGPKGTSTSVFKTFPIPIAGKTGTAERPPYRDQAWYVALAPYNNPRYVVAVTIEEGGFGAETAAPVARKILASLYGVKDRPAVPAPLAGTIE